MLKTALLQNQPTLVSKVKSGAGVSPPKPKEEMVFVENYRPFEVEELAGASFNCGL